MKKILGFTENTTSCDCCGKSELKGTWAVEVEGNIFYLGSTCVHKKGFTTKDKNDFLNKEKQEKRELHRKEFNDYLDSLDNSEFETEEKYY
jgi:hypothetical protein